jgi:hydrogenase maturation protease
MRRVTLLVCGEPMRGDDGVATAIVGALPAATRGLTEMTRVGQLMPDDLLCDGPVILLDAVEGREPGEVVDLSLAALHDVPGSRLVPTSSHALPLPIAVAVAERLGGRLPEGRFIGIATASYALGAGLSPAVRRAIPRCARHLNHWIRVLAHERSPRRCA